ILGLIIVSFLLIRIGLIWFFPEGRRDVTEDTYYKLRIGMSEQECENILGDATKIEKEGFTVWSYPDGVILTVFENGKLKKIDFLLDFEPIRVPSFPI